MKKFSCWSIEKKGLQMAQQPGVHPEQLVNFLVAAIFLSCLAYTLYEICHTLCNLPIRNSLASDIHSLEYPLPEMHQSRFCYSFIIPSISALNVCPSTVEFSDFAASSSNILRLSLGSPFDFSSYKLRLAALLRQ